MSYDSEAQCVAAHTLTPAICRSAFANARAEYEAKTPSFVNQALCRQRFASCMAWPPGAVGAKASFRPNWNGVDIVDTPGEHSVTPAPGITGKAIRFASRPLTEQPATLVIRGAGAPASRGTAAIFAVRPGRPSAAAAFTQHAAGMPEKPLSPSAPPPPGSGFKLENGILTYPAPERFQPKNLPKAP